MHKYSSTYKRNALLPIKFRPPQGAFVDYCHTNGGCVAQVGTWFQVYTKTCIQTNIRCRCGTGSAVFLRRRGLLFGRGAPSFGRWGPAAGTVWKKTGMSGRKGKIILEIRIDICYTDSVPSYVGANVTLPAPRGSVSADKFVRKVSNWKTIPSIS